jgi:hypothetical protein
MQVHIDVLDFFPLKEEAVVMKIFYMKVQRHR